MFEHYIYIYLNPLKSGCYNYNKFSFDFEPFYIGMGKNDRYLSHTKYQNSPNKLKQNILNKINNAGVKPIILKLYENVSKFSAIRLEKYLINLIGRRDLNFGTLSNLCDGGEGSSGVKYTREKRINMISEKRSIIQYNNNGKISNIWENIIDISIQYPDLLTNHIHRACKSNGNRKYNNFFWKYLDNETISAIINVPDNQKPILQYNLNGEFIKEWNSSKDITILGYSSGAVLNVCRNNNSQLTYKYKNSMWIFKNIEILKEIKKYCENNAKGNQKIETKQIKQFDYEMNLLGTYKPKELKLLNFFTKSIYNCCKKKLKKSQGFIWEWA